MNHCKFSFSRLLVAGSFVSLVTMIVAGCDKNDKQAPPPTIPVVTTAALTNITTDGATGGGSIVSDGGAAVTASGLVWSKTNATPTIEDSVVSGTTSSGTFTNEITGLDFNTSYYVRAFATNSVGTGYGSVVTLSTVNDTNKVRFTYNGVEVVYGIIVSPTSGQKWLDRNLGAKQAATAYDDYLAFGDLFQWGRPADGHQLINWTSTTAGVTGTPVNGITSTLATSDVPGHSDFIDATASETSDWRSDGNGNRWATTPQGPCPEGWHVPTEDDWKAEIIKTQGGTAASGGITNRQTAYSLLKLTVAGNRDFNGSQFFFVGAAGYYWSSTDYTSLGYEIVSDLEFGTDSQGGFAGTSVTRKGYGFSVRCIKD
jgi:uncharacterized protein (TIGR02145 family)